jgi:hypothetical protein
MGHGTLSIAFNRRTGGPPPIARFTVTELGQRTFKFDASASTGSTVKYEWNFGDGGTETTFGPVVEPQYKFPGRDIAKLRVIDAFAGADCRGSNSAEAEHELGVSVVRIVSRCPEGGRAASATRSSRVGGQRPSCRSKRRCGGGVATARLRPTSGLESSMTRST